MFAEIESRLHRLRRRFSRSEWAIEHLGLSKCEGTDEQPGLLLIQIDGLARRHLESAMEQGRMPFLRQLSKHGKYRLHTFYSGLPSTTPAVQGELFYGVRSAVPAFCFLDRDVGELAMMYYPDCAGKVEARLQAHAVGLLKNGSSWFNIYSGGAAPEETHFCCAGAGLSAMWRSGGVRNFLWLCLLNIPAVLRVLGLCILEFVIALSQALLGVLHGQWLKQELGVVLSRTFIGVALREIITIGAKIDLARGLPAVHVNFVGYDEASHRRGPGSRFAFWSLTGIDRAIKGLYRGAHRSRRRDYQVWIFSDHGQERTHSFATEFEGGIDRIVADCLSGEQPLPPKKRTPGWWAVKPPRIVYQQLRRRHDRTAAPPPGEEKPPFVIAAAGPVGHLYFTHSRDDEQKRKIARKLIDQGKVPGVLHRHADGTITWHHADGETKVPDEVPARLTTHPEALRTEIARDLIGLCECPNAGDLILLGWSDGDRPWTFPPERGAHAGFGPEETQGFLLVPPATQMPDNAADFVRPAALRTAALALLGREPMEATAALTTDPSVLRIMTYNVHSCIGVDGRVSPQRVARVIAHDAPDVVAVQELDHGRLRSRSEDQAEAIAKRLGYHFVFCPTVAHGEGRYGHAVFSRAPIEVVKIGQLPGDPRSWWPEPRYALWIAVRIAGVKVNVITTHLGLSARERLEQVQTLVGPEWLGPVLLQEPVIVCGDFNLAPGSPGYRLATNHLIDVQARGRGHQPLNTFSSARPFIRIDHIFISQHFVTERVFVPRTHLTRLASDHLPLVADLRLNVPAIAETTTPMRLSE